MSVEERDTRSPGAPGLVIYTLFGMALTWGVDHLSERSTIRALEVSIAEREAEITSLHDQMVVAIQLREQAVPKIGCP